MRLRALPRGSYQCFPAFIDGPPARSVRPDRLTTRQDSESETYIALATRVNVCRRGGPLRPSRAGATNVRVWGPPAGAPQGCSPTSHLLCLISALFQSPRIIASRIWAGVFPCFVLGQARKVSAMQM